MRFFSQKRFQVQSRAHQLILHSLSIHLDDICGAAFRFTSIQGPEPHGYLHAVRHGSLSIKQILYSASNNFPKKAHEYACANCKAQYYENEITLT
jgi:hypothetical protein